MNTLNFEKIKTAEQYWFLATGALAGGIAISLLFFPSQMSGYFFQDTNVFFVQVLGASLAGVSFMLSCSAFDDRLQSYSRRMSIFTLLITIFIINRSWPSFNTELAGYIMFGEHFVLLLGFTYFENRFQHARNS